MEHNSKRKQKEVFFSASCSSAGELTVRPSKSERFWMNLQSRYDLEVEKDKLGRRLINEVHPFAEAG